LLGKDSAGAVVELHRLDTGFTAAKVVDVILGAGEAEIIFTSSNQIEFTIYFPAGVSITYVGTFQYDEHSFVYTVEGIWTQKATAIFGEETGGWEVSTINLQDISQ